MAVLLLSGPSQPALADNTQNNQQLEARLNAWPAWPVPAPLARPRAKQDLVYPDWFEGLWEVESLDLLANGTVDESVPPLQHLAQFQLNQHNDVVGNRPFNARSVGQALLGQQLISVEQAPHQVNRQLARLSDDRLLETTVIGRQQTSINAAAFLSDELVLQVMHGARAPRLSRIETLSRYQPCLDVPTAETINRICVEQWQQTYPAPGEASTSFLQRASRYKLTLTRLQDLAETRDPQADRAIQTRAEGGDDH